MSKPKFPFILQNIDINRIDKKYNLCVQTNIHIDDIQTCPANTTNISDLTISHSSIDDTKKHCITMLDSISKQTIQQTFCFWCKHPYDSYPIGCPLEYVPNKRMYIHTSEITDEQYAIYEKVSKYSEANDDSSTRNTLIHNYYITDGTFCSFNCCMAYITDHTHLSTYHKSTHLLHRMYSDLYGQVSKINPAPHWRVLKSFGGFMDIHEFRNSFSTHLYIQQDKTITSIPKMIAVGHIFEEQYIF